MHILAILLIAAAAYVYVLIGQFMTGAGAGRFIYEDIDESWVNWFCTLAWPIAIAVCLVKGLTLGFLEIGQIVGIALWDFNKKLIRGAYSIGEQFVKPPTNCRF